MFLYKNKISNHAWLLLILSKEYLHTATLYFSKLCFGTSSLEWAFFRICLKLTFLWFCFTEIGINLLLCLSVYLTILNTKMPTRSDAFPLLSKFYGCCIFILTCALLCTCWVVTYYFHDMSGWQIYSMSKFVEVSNLAAQISRLKYFYRDLVLLNTHLKTMFMVLLWVYMHTR